MTPTNIAPPASIMAARMQAVWGLRDTAGCKLPVGMPQTAPVSVLASTQIQGADLRGGVFAQGDDTELRISDSILRARGLAKMLALGSTPGGVTLGKGSPRGIISRTTLDLSGDSTLTAAPISGYNNASLSFDDVRMIEASRNFIAWAGPGHLELLNSFVGAFGVATDAKDHCEGPHIEGGSFLFNGDLFAPDLGSPLTGALTAAIYIEGLYSPVVGAISHSIVDIPKGPVLWTMQVCARKFDVELTIGNTGMRKGSSGYIGKTALGGKLRIRDVGGNFDLTTGAPVNHATH